MMAGKPVVSPGSGPERKFFADAMLGRLATWMRAMGYDTLYVDGIADADLVERAASDGRIILTRDHLLVERRGARDRSVIIESDHVREQIAEVAERFPPRRSLFLSRCLRCNAPLAPIAKESVRERVPEYVYDTQESFSICHSCKRLYWGGTHRDAMKKEFRALYDRFGVEE